MRSPTGVSLLPALSLLLATLCGCGTETVHGFTLNDPDDPVGMDAETDLDLLFWPDSSLTGDLRFRLRIDGQWVVWAADATYVTLQPRTLFPALCNNLAGAIHSVELVGPGGVTLATGPLAFAAGRNNQLVVYGGAAGLRYQFFANSTAEVEATLEDQVLTRIISLLPESGGVDILTCPLTAASAVDCTPTKSGLTYGQLWQGTLARDGLLAVACQPADSIDLCVREPLARRCFDGTAEGRAPKTETIVLLADAGRLGTVGHFVSFELSATTCSMPLDTGTPSP